MPGNRDEHEELREVKAVLQSLSKISSDRLPAGASGDGEHNVITLESLNRGSAPQGTGQGRAVPKKGGGVHRKQLGAFALATLAGGTVLVLATDMFFKYGMPSIQQGSPAMPVAAAGSPPASIGTMRAAYPSQTPASIAQPPTSPFATATVSAAPPSTPAPAATAALPAKAPVAVAAQPQVAVPAAIAAPSGPPSPAIASAKQMMDSGKVAAARGLLQPLANSQDAAWLLARSYDPNYLATVKAPDAPGDKEKAFEWYRRWRDIGAQNGVMIDDARLKRLIDTLD